MPLVWNTLAIGFGVAWGGLAWGPRWPLTNWASFGGVTEVLPGQFQITDPQATNSPRRIYCVRSP